MSTPKYAVGDTVYVHRSYSRTGPEKGEVVKVGRTLVHVQARRRDVEQFSIATGHQNNSGGSAFIRTVAEYEKWERDSARHARARSLEVDLPRSISEETANAILDLVENDPVRVRKAQES